MGRLDLGLALDNLKLDLRSTMTMSGTGILSLHRFNSGQDDHMILFIYLPEVLINGF